MAFDEKAEVEERPAFEIHLGETSVNKRTGKYRRYSIVWINGKRWEGYLTEGPDLNAS